MPSNYSSQMSRGNASSSSCAHSKESSAPQIESRSNQLKWQRVHYEEIAGTISRWSSWLKWNRDTLIESTFVYYHHLLSFFICTLKSDEITDEWCWGSAQFRCGHIDTSIGWMPVVGRWDLAVVKPYKNGKFVNVGNIAFGSDCAFFGASYFLPLSFPPSFDYFYYVTLFLLFCLFGWFFLGGDFAVTNFHFGWCYTFILRSTWLAIN